MNLQTEENETVSSPNDAPGAHVVIATYRPKEGCDERLRGVLARHVPYLREVGLATDRPVQFLRAKDGTYLEIFEWFPGGAQKAHEHDGVMRLWAELAELADFPPPAELEECGGRFPHFALVEL